MELTFDLTPYIREAGQYEIIFQTMEGSQPVKIEDEILFQSGQEANPGILTRKGTAVNVLHFSRTAVVTDEADIRLQVTLTGHGSSGMVLIQRVQ
jgi:hypothetical protein